jgi:SepF-like predicted cell division protein (DUF552 family)
MKIELLELLIREDRLSLLKEANQTIDEYQEYRKNKIHEFESKIIEMQNDYKNGKVELVVDNILLLDIKGIYNRESLLANKELLDTVIEKIYTIYWDYTSLIEHYNN